MFIRNRGSKSALKDGGIEGGMESTPLAVLEEGGAAAASLSLADVEMQSIGKKRSVAVSAYSAAQKGAGLISTITYGLFGATIVVCSMAMTIYDSTLILSACSISILVSIYGMQQRVRLDRMGPLRAAYNKIRMEVNRLMSENDTLTRQINELEIQANRLKNMESRLSGILSSQGRDVDTFVSRVRENQAVMDAMKEAMKAQISQNIVSMLMKADKDEDMLIDPEEVKGLLFRLRAFDGLEVNEEMFRLMLEKKGNSISAVVGLIKDLMDDESHEETVFTVKPKEMTTRNLEL